MSRILAGYGDSDFEDIFIQNIITFTGDVGDFTLEEESGNLIISKEGVEIANFDTDQVVITNLAVSMAEVIGDFTVDTPTFHVDSTNDKVGIGTLTPASDLTVVNTATDSTIMITSNNASSCFLSMGDNNDNNIGQIEYDNVTNDMVLYTNNSEKMRIQSGGNIGIGTNSPNEKLHIDGIGATRIQITNDTTGSTASDGFCIEVSASNDVLLINTESTNMAFFTSGTERMRITDDGFISVGGSFDPTLDLAIGDANTGFNQQGEDQLAIYTGGTERMRITSAGFVGIGTTNPNKQLHVQGSGDQIIKLSTTTDSTVQIEFETSDSGNAFVGFTADSFDIFSVADKPMIIGVNNAERMRIETGGDIGMGTSNPVDKLHIHESSSGDNKLRITNDTTGATAGDGFSIGLSADEDVLIENFEATNMIFYTSGTERMRINSDGDITVAGHITSGGQITSNPIFLHSERDNNSFSINDTSQTNADFNNNVYNNGFSTTTGTTFTIPEDGLYQVSYQTTFASNSTGYREAFIMLDSGTGEPGRAGFSNTQAVNGTLTGLTGSALMNLTSGAVIVLSLEQTSGGALQVGGTGDQERAYIQILKVANLF